MTWTPVRRVWSGSLSFWDLRKVFTEAVEGDPGELARRALAKWSVGITRYLRPAVF